VADGLTRADAEALDAADPLAPLRSRFVVDDGGPVYVDGNSLGRLPHATAERMAAFAEEWGSRLVTGWPDWIELPRAVGDVLAEHVLGARPGEVLVCDSVTVNLFKLAGAVLDAEAGPLVGLAGDFPTDRYVLEGLARAHGVDLRLVDRGELAAAARDARLTVVSKVDYRSGEVLPDDLPGLVLWDLSHAAGAIELDLRGSGAQLAVGCTYKYLNGGPGAPAFLYVREDLQERLRSPIQGWFSQKDQFAMGPRYEPAAGIDRFLAGTPSIVDLVAVRSGAELVAEAGMPAIAAKTRALTGLFVALHDAWLAPLGFALASPRDAAARGGHVSLAHPDGWRVCRALIERANVVPDFRRPDVVRFGFPALYTRFTDVFEAAERTRDLVASGAHLDVQAAPMRVT
jgi:kynureninase